MRRDATPAAVLLDALGTIVELERPWPLLVSELRARGVEVSEDDARRAMLAEMGYYRTHHDEARDEAGLADLRRRCAGVIQAQLRTPLSQDDVLGALLGAVRFRAYPEVPRVLARLRARGARLAVVSNWDVSLHDVLERTALRPFVDAVAISAVEGTAKPDPAIFAVALERLGAQAQDAVHVGDSVEHDVDGARAAGIVPIFVARDGEAGPEGVRTISTLDELAAG